MAGYLTHVMVLIKAEAWLGELIAAIERRRNAQGGCLGDVEEALLGLARHSRALLRVDPAAAQRLPATRIENGVGTDLSKYALAGAIGMDFPINGHVLALNRDWVARTMHLGAPRRAYVRAGSTEFVLNFIKALNDSGLGLTPEQQRAMRSYALGHLAGVAADVILQPAVNAWAWADENRDRLDQHRFAVQLDARVAQGFFQRDDLHGGQSWEDYFLSSGDVERESEKLTTVFLKAFRDTYGGVRPAEALCALGAGRCRAPELTEAFLKDAFANTKNWAIGVGYDQSPRWWFKPLLSALIFGGGMAVVGLAWGATASYNLQSWRDGEGFETERLWYDMLDSVNTFAGVVYLPLAWPAKFPVGWSGIFGQGTIGATERPPFEAFLSIFKGVYDFLSFVFDRVVGIAGLADETSGFYTSVDPFRQQLYVRWPRLGFCILLEVLKAVLVDKGSVEKGEEGDRLGFTLFWPVKVSTFATYLVSALLVFGAKSRREEDSGDTESTASGWDFVIGMIAPAALICIAWHRDFFEKRVLEDVAGAQWPDTETGAVNRFLPVRAENSRRSFDEAGAAGFAVSLLAPGNQGVVTAQDGREHYAESADASPYETRRRRDDEARKQKRQSSSKNDYKMTQLFDRAAHLAGLLAMAAVNYDAVGPRVRDHVKEVFKDWNLDYRTVAEWDALMKERSGSDMGLLTAAAQWWDDLRRDRPSTDQPVLDRIDQEMTVTGFSGQLIADFTHTSATLISVPPIPPDARCSRLKRPGAILLANLNIDDPITTPLPSPLPDRRTMLDAVKDNTIAGRPDEIQLTQFGVQRPARPAAVGYELILKVHSDDAARIRVFEVNRSDPSPSWPRRFGADTGGAHLDRYAIPAGGGDSVSFCVEALTLPGDPVLRSPAAPAPFGGDGVTPVAPSRAHGDVWVELLHRDGGSDLPNVRDVALFTIAPWLMFSNLQPTKRLYVVYIKDIVDRDGILHANHPTVADLVAGMTVALGAPRVPVRTRPVPGGGSEFVPHRPLPGSDPDAAQGLYIIDGSAYCNDPWIQDEIEIGYCWAPQPHAWTHMTIHSPRKRGLEGFVHKELPASDMALFNSLNHEWDSINYGGNLEVSPPVDRPTDPIAAGQAGLAVPAQRRAPFGKILLGEGLASLLRNVDTSIAGDLDAGGVPSSAVRTEFSDKGMGLVIADITVVTAGSEWRVRFAGAAALPEFRIRLESGNLNVYLFNPVGSDALLFNIDPGLIADLDLGGPPSERVQEAFLQGVTLAISSITVITAGSEWVATLAGPPALPRLAIRLESGRLNVYAINPSGPDELLFIPNHDAALLSDLDLGGAPSERVNRAFALFFCKFKPFQIELPVPRITVRTPGSEWLVTMTGRRGRPMMLIRREGGNLALFEARIAQPAFRTFLEAQAVQPILSFDTSWLHVGHVDEVAIFVPATGGRGSKLLMSSTQRATAILAAAVGRNAVDPSAHPLTEMFRGRKRLRRVGADHLAEDPAVVSVAALLASHRAVNDELQAERLTPIENRLKAGLRLEDTDIIHIPVYYDVSDMPPGTVGNAGRTSAHTPHMVNLQVVDRHVMVPRPFGPRMNIADVELVLTNVGVPGVTARRLGPLVGHWHWARRGDRVAGPGGMAATFGVSEAAIRSHINNGGKFTAAGTVRNNWDRIWIPEDNIDLFEACVQLLLEDVGLTVHWIDDWDTYHRQKGEIHCGTNVVRAPPEAAPNYGGPYWWDHYHP